MGVRHRNYLSQYKDKSRHILVETGDNPATVGAGFLTGAAGYSLFILRLVVHVRTSAAQAITFRDTSGSPITFWVLPASSAAGAQINLCDVQDGPGVQITEGKGLDFTGAAGNALTIEVVAYLKPTGTLTGGKRTTTTV